MRHQIVIEPFVGVGPILFGMHKDEVGRAFRYVYKSFLKGPDATVRADDIEYVGLIVHYSTEKLVDYIEVFQAPGATVELFGRDITGISVRALVDFLSPRFLSTKNEYGYDFPEVGLNTYNSEVDWEDDPVQCLGVASRDYWRT